MKLVVKNNYGQKFTLQIRPNETFLDLKRRVELESGISLDLRDITTNKRNINESQKVIDYFLNEQNQQQVQQLPPEVVCAVPTCDNKKSQKPHKSYFDFPDEEIRCHQWILYCRRIAAHLTPENPKSKLPANIGVPGTAICSDHFRTDQFVKNTTTLLKRTAVPCVNPELPVNVEPSTNYNKNNLGVALESKYDFFAKHGGKGRPLPSQKTKTKNILQDSLSSSQQAAPTSIFGSSSVNLTCRLCANPSRNTVFIYSREGKNMMLAEKICATLPIRVKMTDKLPKQVCRSCIEKLNSAFYLVEVSTTTDENLRSSKTKHKEVDEKLALGECPCCVEGRFQLLERDDEAQSQAEDLLAFPDLFTKDHTAEVPETSSVTESHNEGIPNQIDTVGSEQGEYVLSDILDLEGSINGEEVYLCRLCGASMTSQDGAVDHALSHGSEGFFQCISCENYYSNPQELVDHFVTHGGSGASSDPGVVCDKCGENFISVLASNDHRCEDVKDGEGEPTHKCALCSKSFPTDHRLQFHMKFHTGSLKGDCPSCEMSFGSESKLYNHFVEEHDEASSPKIKTEDGAPTRTEIGQTEMEIGEEEMAQCEKCGKFFSSYAAMKIHESRHGKVNEDGGTKPFACEWCGKGFLRRSILRNHVNLAHKPNPEGSCFTCKICKEAFASTNQGVTHMDTAHNNYVECEPAYSFEMITVTRLFLCEYCEKVYAEPAVLNKHREVDHGPSTANPSFGCKFCGRSYNSYSELQDHKSDEHEHPNIIDEFKGENLNVPITFLCEFCDRGFVNFVKYTEHQTIHFGAEPYVCRICGLRFAALAQVNDHRSVHGDYEPLEDVDLDRPYDCHYCNKTFAIEDALIKHIRMHTGEKPFACDICGKAFSQSSGLNTHKKVHSDDRPFSCHLCPRTFKIKGDRDVHIRKHSGQRPFKCEFCFKAFMTQHVYSQHRKIHTGERPYRCDVCHVAFRRSHVLTVHKRIHTGEKPNVCDVCGKRYRQKGDMLKHKRSQHGFIKEGEAKAFAAATAIDTHFLSLKTTGVLDSPSFQ